MSRILFAHARSCAAVAVLMLMVGPATAQEWTWKSENLAVGAATYPSIVADKEDGLHLSFVGPKGLTYAYRAKGQKGWFALAVDGGLGHTDIALDAQERPHICYMISDARLRYAFFNGTRWVVQPIAAGSGGIQYTCSVAVDKDNTPHIFWYQTSFPGREYLHLRHAVLKDGKWLVSTVDMAGETGKWNSAQVIDGKLSIAYSEWTNAELHYATWDGEHWSVAIVDHRPQGIVTNEHPLVGASLAADSKHHPAISYESETELKFAAQDDSGAWKTEKVDALGSRPEWYDVQTALVFDKQDQPHIFYQDGTFLKHAYRNGSGWHVQLLVGQGTDPTRFPSATVDHSGNLLVAYRDPDDGTLKLATGKYSGAAAPAKTASAPSPTAPTAPPKP